MENNKFNIKYLHFAFESFTLENFQSTIINKFKLNTTYSLLLKISSHNNLTFKMCGPQIGLVIGEEHDLNYYYKLYNLILIRIETTVDSYNYLDKIDGIEISYSVIKPQKELTLKNISLVPLNQQMIPKKEVKKNFNQNLLPLTLDSSYYGHNILSEERQNLIKLISNPQQLGLSEKDLNINDSDKLFIFNSPNKKNKFIILSKTLEDKQYLRYIFYYNTGIFIKKIKILISA